MLSQFNLWLHVPVTVSVPEPHSHNSEAGHLNRPRFQQSRRKTVSDAVPAFARSAGGIKGGTCRANVKVRGPPDDRTEPPL